MIDFIWANKEWIFSGIGVFTLSLFISLFLRKKKSTNSVKIRGSSNKVKQLGSKTENNIDIDGDMNDVNQP